MLSRKVPGLTGEVSAQPPECILWQGRRVSEENGAGMQWRSLEPDGEDKYASPMHRASPAGSFVDSIGKYFSNTRVLASHSINHLFRS